MWPCQTWGQTATANLTLGVIDAPWRSPLLFSMKPNGPGVGKQVDTMLAHLPPARCGLDHDRTGSDSWGVSAESRSSKELLRKKSEGTQHVPRSSFGDKRTVPRLPCRHQEPGFRAAPGRGPASLGLEVVAAGRVHPGAPRPALPFSPAASFQALQRSNVHHSVFWLRESRLRPAERSARRWRTRFRISLQLFRYWCRSKEYTKGSDAALL